MKGADIANQLKARLPNYTTDFSDEVSVTSLSRSGTTVTATTTSAHGRSTNDNVTIKGAKEPITITSLTRSDSIVTAICNTPHKLPNPSNFKDDQSVTIEISGADPSDYNGSFTLESTPDYYTFTYKVTTTPTTPATTAGSLLLNNDLFLYNGLKTITVIDTTTFTYEVESENLQTPAQGTITALTGARIAYAATFEVAEDHYAADSDRVTQNWIYIVVGDRESFKKDTTTTDVTSVQDANAEYRYDTLNPFSIFIFIPSKNTEIAGIQSDQAREYIQPLLKSIANFLLPSPLTEGCLNPVTYQGDGIELYNGSYYVHRFDFVAKGEIVAEDTIDAARVVPFQTLEASIQDKDTEMTINFDIDN